MNLSSKEPTIFSGTLRFNLDPGDKFSDDDVYQALHTAGLGKLVNNLEEGLQHQISERGTGFSLGEKQLICLARALLRRSKVLVLDEATAAVDGNTDATIQETLRTEFRDCTVITIAHRLNTVVTGDNILVLDRGQIIETGSPTSLIEDKNSNFHKMAKTSGII